MIYTHESILRVYPNTDLCVQDNIDGTFQALVWNGNSYDPFTYDEAKVKAANDAIIIEHQWSDFRETRDNLLAETDWMANSDVTMSDAWKTYRQALRDLPANTSDPANPTYPTKPE
tara:strand:- start:366 stop:713 length:348 start_codon:yes stop_codon:yes gene_type:complete